MKKNILKKISIGLLSAAMMVSMTACNTKIKVNYDYKAEDYVTLGEYKGIEVSVDTDAIENNLIIIRFFLAILKIPIINFDSFFFKIIYNVKNICIK